MKIVNVLRRGRVNASVVTDTDLRVKVPVELGEVGIELDEERLGSLSQSGSYNYLSPNSYIYKQRFTDYSAVTNEQWDQFYKLTRVCLGKLVKKGWVAPSSFQQVYDEFISEAADRGIPYRMWRRPQEVGVEGYLYTVIKGYLLDSYRVKAREQKRYVSLEYLVSIGAI